VPPRLNAARAPSGHYAETNTAPQGVSEKVQDEELYFLKMMAWLKNQDAVEGANHITFISEFNKCKSQH
jgi:hypothetical protein